VPEQGETIHNWVFKVELGLNHAIKNRFGIGLSIPASGAT